MNSTGLETLYEFRPLTQDNLGSVKLLHNELLPIRYGDNFYKALMDGMYKLLLLYEKDGDLLIGLSTWKIEWRDEDHRGTRVQTGYLATFGIRQSFRGRGLGFYLMECTMSMMKEMNCKWTELHVLTTNVSAINLYLKCGYTNRMMLPNHYHYHNKRHDAYLLTKPLMTENVEYDENEESKSEHIIDGKDRSPPYYRPESDINVEIEDSLDGEINEITTTSPHRRKTRKQLPISNWMSESTDSLWIKCLIL